MMIEYIIGLILAVVLLITYRYIVVFPYKVKEKERLHELGESYKQQELFISEWKKTADAWGKTISLLAHTLEDYEALSDKYKEMCAKNEQLKKQVLNNGIPF